MKLIKDLGMRFPNENSKRKARYGIYECPICNKHSEVQTNNAKRANGCNSCGQAKKKTTHGQSGLRLWRIWSAMNSRCYNKNNTSYRWYGEKGVTVCDEWKNDFFAFKKWSLDNGYSEWLELDKDTICNNNNIHPKIYSPDTCIWIPKVDNIRIKTRTHDEEG